MHCYCTCCTKSGAVYGACVMRLKHGQKRLQKSASKPMMHCNLPISYSFFPIYCTSFARFPPVSRPSFASFPHPFLLPDLP